MTTRVTEKMLERLASEINQTTGSPEATYTIATVGGVRNHRANVGNYHVDHDYGGVALHQVTNANGRARDVLRTGHVPKRRLYELMDAYLAGIKEEQAAQKEKAYGQKRV